MNNNLVCAPGLWKKQHDHDDKGNCIPKGYTCNDINCMCYDCVKEHRRNGCNFGMQDGPDDNVKECDCDYKG